MSKINYTELIPDDDDQANARVNAVTALSALGMALLGKQDFLRAWWAFFWLNPCLHPDDFEEWPDEVEDAKILGNEAYCRFKAHNLSDYEYYPNAMARQQSGLSTRVSWAALKTACQQTGVIIIDDTAAVYADIPESAQGRILLRTYNVGEVYARLQEADNVEVEVSGSSMWALLMGDEEPSQLSFYKTWVVADDLNLSKL